MIEPTPYSDINVVLDSLLSSVQNILGDFFVGLYLYGSLASGDFNLRRSDIDFVVVTTAVLPDEKIAALRALHADLKSGGLAWADRLEGDYVPQAALRRADPNLLIYPHLGADGHFEIEDHGMDVVIQHYLLREHGQVVVGPNPKSLIDPIEPDELRQAAAGILQSWWAPQLNDHTRLKSREYQAYAVLTMCRALYTMHFGAIASKPIAARWAAETLDSRWTPVIKNALAWRLDVPANDYLNETLDFIRLTLELCRQRPSSASTQ